MNHKLRENLKSGALRGIYATIRRIKRQLKGEPLAGNVPIEFPPMTASEIRELVARLPEMGRLYFTLGLIALDEDSAEALRDAEACLRCAGTLKFESPERIALYRGLIAAKRGEPEIALAFVSSLKPYELTDTEQKILANLVNGSVTALLPTSENKVTEKESVFAQRLLEIGSVKSLLVIGEDAAFSSAWKTEADYLLVSARLTGLTLEGVARLGKAFSVGIGSLEAQQKAKGLEIVCETWLELP